jgi:hypothetical protein
VLTWGRNDDASFFEDADLSFVLFRLPIAGPTWWGLGIKDQAVRDQKSTGGLLTSRMKAEDKLGRLENK